MRYRLVALSGDRVLDHLACLGLVWITGGRLWHEGTTPVLETNRAVSAHTVMNHGMAALQELPPQLSGNVTRAFINTLSQDTWERHDTVFGPNMDEDGSAGNPLTDEQIADGKQEKQASYPMGNLWNPMMKSPLSESLHKVAHNYLSAVNLTKGGTGLDLDTWILEDLELLLSEQSVPPRITEPTSTVGTVSLLGYSPTDAQTTERYDSKAKFVSHGLEFLAAVAVIRLAPRGRIPNERGTRWLRWHLNPAPMNWDALVALHRRLDVPGMARCTVSSREANKYFRFGPVEVLDPTEAEHAHS